MSDSVVLEALYAVPTTAAPATGYPAIVFVHGFGGSKESVRADVRAHAQNGYVGVAYSVRGQGNSGGEFDFFTSERVRGDLQTVILFTRTMPGVDPDRVGVVGGSQGGIHAWAAAAYDMGVRAVVSWIANGRFDEDWLGNNALNWLFARTITLTSVRLKQALRDSMNLAMQSGDYSFVKGILDRYSTASLETSVQTPALMLVSYHDQFFNPTSALRQFARIPGPKRICLYPGGHESPPDAGTNAHITGIYNRWIAHWLKDVPDPLLLSPDSAVTFFDGATAAPQRYAVTDTAIWLDSAAPLSPPYRRATWYFTQTALAASAPASQSTRTITYTNLLGSTPIAFRTPPFASDVTVVGGGCTAQLLVDGSASVYQYNLMLFDVDPATNAAAPVTRGQYEIRGNVPGEGDAIPIALNAVCHTVRAGHVIEARIHGGVPLVPSTSGNDFGNIAYGPVQNSTNTLYLGGIVESMLTLTLRDASTVAAEPPAVPTLPALGDVFPNPLFLRSSPLVTVRCATGGRPASVVVVDMLGRAVTAEQALPEAALPEAALPEAAQATDALLQLRQLPSGTYRVVLTSEGMRVSKPLQIIR
jgi:predicted acyl esterase